MRKQTPIDGKLKRSLSENEITYYVDINGPEGGAYLFNMYRAVVLSPPLPPLLLSIGTPAVKSQRIRHACVRKHNAHIVLYIE